MDEHFSSTDFLSFKPWKFFKEERRERERERERGGQGSDPCQGKAPERNGTERNGREGKGTEGNGTERNGREGKGTEVLMRRSCDNNAVAISVSLAPRAPLPLRCYPRTNPVGHVATDGR